MEGFDHLAGLHAPGFEAAFLADEFVHVFVGWLDLFRLGLVFGFGDLLLDYFVRIVVVDGGHHGCVFVDGFLELLDHGFGGGLFCDAKVEGVELDLDVVDAGIDDFRFLSVDVFAAGFDAFCTSVPLFLADGVANEFLDAGSAHVYVSPDWTFAFLVQVVLFEVKPYFHTLSGLFFVSCCERGITL